MKNVPKYINMDFSIFTLLQENNTAIETMGDYCTPREAQIFHSGM